MSTLSFETTQNAAVDKRARLAELLRQKIDQGKKPFPLSHGQRALWFISQLAPGNYAYNLPIALPFSEEIELSALTRALDTVWRRHACLQTIFIKQNHQVVQQIMSAKSPGLQCPNVSGFSRGQLRQRMREENRRPFDLEKGPLVRACLFSRSKEDHILLLTIHHIVFDGISSLILLDELLALYDSLKAGKRVEMTQPSGEYADFVRWQQELLEGPEEERLWQYWQEQLAGELPVIALPTDRPRPALQTYNGDTWRFQVDEPLTRRLKQLAHAEDVTLFMLLLAAFQLLLHRYSSHPDIITGSPMMGRTQPGLERVIGYFINMVAIRGDLSSDPSFRSFLRQIASKVYGALEHQDYPFPLLVQRLKVPRDPSCSPIFQVEFNLETWIRDADATSASSAFRRLRLEPFTLLHQEGEFDLALDVFDMEEKLDGAIRYNPDLFDKITICRMAEHFRVLLRGLCDGPGKRLSELSILTDFERERLLKGWNNTRAPYPKDQCFHELFEAQAKQNPERVALIYEEQSLSYGELNARSNQVAHYLRRLGVGPGSLVGVCLERSPEVLLATLGVMKSGAAYVPLDPAYPQERLSFMMADAGLSVLLTQQRLGGVLQASTVKQVHLDAGWESIGVMNSTHSPGGSGPDSLAYVIYTSGSTGKPKGVEVTHRSLVNFLHAVAIEPGIEETDVLLAVTTLSFDISALELYLPLLKGARVVIATQAEVSDGWKLLAKIKSCGATILQATPATWRLMLTCGWNDPLDLKMVCGGEALSRELADQLLGRGRDLWNMYGPTETTIWSTTCKVRPGSEPVSIGRPIANTQVYVLDAHQQIVPIGTAGELYIGGDGLARGYLGQARLTAEKFIPHPFSKEKGARLYRTGDQVRYLRDGNLLFLGRMDSQVKTRGFRVELGEIEAALASHPAVSQVAVLARQEAAGETQLVAYWTKAGSQDPSIADFRDHLRRSLPEYMIPAAFVPLDALPLTPNGKLDRKALPAPGETRDGLKEAYVRPRNVIEKKLMAIWSSALERIEVGVYDNFFELGGHSLLATQVVARMREDFDVELLDLFTYPSISSLAEYLSKKGLPPVQEEESQVIGAMSEREGAQQRFPERDLSQTRGDIAIIGMAGRFPGAPDIEAFWRNLINGVESISSFTDEELLASGVSPDLLSRPDYVKAGGPIAGTDLFDAAFFGYSHAHAKVIDPQQRLLLECAWEALEDAGCNPDRLAGAVGVYLAVADNTYYTSDMRALSKSVSPTAAFQAYTSNDKDFAATRVSYKLNLKGPSFTVQTACSSSLVAVHLACQSLMSGECDLALAGGASLVFPQTVGYLYQRDMVLSPDGHCRAFDAKAQGTVPSNGVALVALRPLDQAVADGDHIYAVIKGSAINNDGSLKVDYVAPSVQGQAEVIARAMARAHVSPETIGYVETHGTGTAVGDPIEIKALSRAFSNGNPRKGSCAIGSVKTNIGHLNTASGVAGLIKAALALKHRVLIPSLHFEEPNPLIDFENSPFYVSARLADWPAGDTPRRAGVSSFGIGGTNAHAVLEEVPESIPQASSRGWYLLPLSAKTPSGLEAVTVHLAQYLKRHSGVDVADVSYTLQVGRKVLEDRQFLICNSREDALTALETKPAGRIISLSETPGRLEPPVAFLFPGEGTQYVRMGWELYQTEPTFRAILNHFAEILMPVLEIDFRQILYPEEAKYEESYRQVQQISLAQPLLFAVEYALAKLWESWGIRPEIMFGQGVGEFVAASLAGVFSPEDALTQVAEQARLIQQLPPGCMFEVSLPEQELRPMLSEHLALAAVNSPNQCCVAGPAEAMDPLCRKLVKRGVAYRRLPISHALHTPQMAAVVDRVRERLTTIELRPPRIPLLSGSTAAFISSDEATAPDYWAGIMMKTVRFSDGLAEILKEPGRVLQEVGPRKNLAASARSTIQGAQSQLLHSLAALDEGCPDSAAMLNSLGHLWLWGKPINWSGFYTHDKRRKVSLPTYPFERSPHWLEEGQQSRARIPASVSGDPRAALVKVHPLIDSNESTLEEEVFKKTFTGSEFFLRDHVLANHKVLPGVVCLEMARAAGELALRGSRVTGLMNIAWAVPIVVSGNYLDLYINLLPGRDGVDYEITTSQGPGKVLHSKGRLIYEPDSKSVFQAPSIALDEIKSRCRLIGNRKDLYAKQRLDGFESATGPSLQPIQELLSNDHEALARLQLPEHVLDSFDEYLLHPSIMDGALQSVGALLQNEMTAAKTPFLPFLLGELRIVKPLSRECYAYVTTLARGDNGSGAGKAVKTFQISIVDPRGNVLVQLRDYTVKFFKLESLPAIVSDLGPTLAQPLLYQPVWQKADLRDPTKPTPSQGEIPSIILFCLDEENEGEGERLRNLLQAKIGRNRPVVLVQSGGQFLECGNQVFRIDPEKQQDCHRLLEALQRHHIDPAHILYLASKSRVEEDGAADTRFMGDVHFIFSLSKTLITGDVERRINLLFLNHGAEPQPLQAAVAGFARSIRLENPKFLYRTVQVFQVEADIDRLADIVMAEFQNSAADQQIEVRYRSTERLVKMISGFRNLPLSNQHAGLAGDKALTPARPDRSNTGLHEIGREHLDLDSRVSPKQIAGHLEPDMTRLGSEFGLESYKELLPQVSALSSAYVRKAFQRLGWQFTPFQRVTTSSLAEQFGVASQHHRLLGRLCEILEEEGLLLRGNSDWEIRQVLDGPDPQEIWSSVLARYPMVEAELTLLGRCGNELAEVLQGKCDPLQLIFPKGSLTAVEKLYQNSPLSCVMNSLIQEAVSKTVEGLPAGRTIRILELGGGTGGTTSYVLPRLPADRTEYVFTDLTSWFTSRARQKFRQYPFFHCQLLDLELDPGAQGFAPHQFDVILAANVLHATSDLRRTLSHVRQLLAPEGLLVLLEGTGRQTSADLVFGLTEGWWKFADLDLRPSYPLLSRHQWLTLLEESGFSEAVTIPENQEKLDLYQQAVILARGPRVRQEQEESPLKEKGTYFITGGAGSLGLIIAEYLARKVKARVVLTGRSELTPDKRKALQAIEECGSEVLYLQADVTSLAAMTTAVKETRNRFGPLNGVFHCAGLLEDNSLRHKTKDSFERVLAPKVTGTLILDAATRSEELDFFAMFSSLSAVIGTPGQCDYSAGNGFMDGFAELREKWRGSGKRSGFTLSIDWLLWQGGNRWTTPQVEQMMLSIGLKPLTTEMGLVALATGLKARVQQLIVVGGDKARIDHLFQTQGASAAKTIPARAGLTAGTELGSVQEMVREVLKMKVSGILEVEETAVNTNTDLGAYGLDSLSIIDFVSQINKHYSLNLSPAIFFEHKTIDGFAAYLVEQYPDIFREHYANRDAGEPLPERDQHADPAPSERWRFVERLVAPPARMVVSETVVSREPIAVIGMNGVFPQSPNLETFWKNLLAGKNLIREVPKERWDWEAYFGDPQKEANKTNIKWGGFIDDVDKFDPLFFNISPREADLMDPQQRLFLQTVWKTIEDAGYKPSSLAGSRTGIFVGISASDYSELMRKRWVRSVDLYSGSGIAYCMLANRVSYLLNLHGPSEPIDTACSSSLVAVHRAVEAIYNGDCEQAIAGGVNVMLTPTGFIYFSKSGLLSPDGRCKAFDKQANGYVRGEGTGAVLLKPLSKAIADGDHIYGLIKGAAVNHGGRAKSLGAPNPLSEAEVVVKALERAQIDPETVTYIEAHGTGTPLGDPIEISSLKKAFAELNQKRNGHTPRKRYCGIGSVKSNIGHLEGAAGVAGLIKVLLSLNHKKLPPTVHFTELNPYIEIDDSPFFIMDRARDWEAHIGEDGKMMPRRAGVSSFGFGGVNAHVVIEEYRTQEPRVLSTAPEQAKPELILLSARNKERLKEYAQMLVDWLSRSCNPQELSGARIVADSEPPGLADIAFTLQEGREAMAERLALIVSSPEELQSKLQSWLQCVEAPYVPPDKIKSGTAKSKPGDPNQSGRDVIQSLIERNKIEELAALWVDGASIDWAPLHRGRGRKRLSLPTYPFARERCWLTEPEEQPFGRGPNEKERLELILDQVAADELAIDQAVELIKQRAASPSGGVDNG